MSTGDGCICTDLELEEYGCLCKGVKTVKGNNKEKIIKAAQDLAVEIGVINLTRAGVCESAGIPDGSFPNIMGCSFTDFIGTLDKSNGGFHAITKKRLSKDDRKDHILRTALNVSVARGYMNVTAAVLAKEANVTTALVYHYYGTMKQLRRAIMRAAIDSEVPEVIAQGLSIGDANAKKAPEALKQLAASVLVK